jgi:hypothetical protein
MTEIPIEEILPVWIQLQRPEILHSINSILINSPLKDGPLAITAQGLTVVPEAFFSAANFVAFLRMARSCGQQLYNSPYFLAPPGRDDLVIKIDPVIRSMETLLTVSNLNRGMPRQGDTFIFEPVLMYFATNTFLCMERVRSVQPTNIEEHRRFIEGRFDLTQLTRSLDIPCFPGGNDVLLRGFDPDGRPILSIIDQDHGKVLEILRSRPEEFDKPLVPYL